MGWTPHTYQELAAAGAYDTNENLPITIVYPNGDGTTGGSSYNYNPPSSNSDPYGGQPISINVGNSAGEIASGLGSMSGVLGQGFQGLFDLINSNTDKNNAWSAAQADKQMAFQERMNQIAMDYNSMQASRNRDWQTYMSNSAHVREVADLKAAGLNPVLSASGGNGAAVGSGATAQGVTSSGAMADADQSGNAALASIYGALINAQTQMYNANLSAKTNLGIAEMQKEASMYGANIAAEASKYAAGTNYAASKYGADINAETMRSNNPWQIITNIVDNLAGNGSRGSAAENLKEAADELGKNAWKLMWGN